MINPFEQRAALDNVIEELTKADRKPIEIPKPESKPIKYDPNSRKPLKFEMEAPGEYKMVNNHGTAVRRLPKIKGKAAKKQAKAFRHMLTRNRN